MNVVSSRADTQLMHSPRNEISRIQKAPNLYETLFADVELHDELPSLMHLTTNLVRRGRFAPDSQAMAALGLARKR